MTASIIVFLMVLAVSFRTIIYGIWNFRVKNPIGGIFVLFLALSSVILAVRYVIKA